MFVSAKVEISSVNVACVARQNMLGGFPMIQGFAIDGELDLTCNVNLIDCFLMFFL